MGRLRGMSASSRLSPSWVFTAILAIFTFPRAISRSLRRRAQTSESIRPMFRQR